MEGETAFDKDRFFSQYVKVLCKGRGTALQ